MDCCHGLSEPELYNLHAAPTAAREEAKTYALHLMIRHLVVDHGVGVREVAKRFGMKWTKVKEIAGPGNG